MLWDIFCKVIDNHGDIGVCWRLSAQLAALGHEVRLWVDDASALKWMAPRGEAGVQVLPWDETAVWPDPGDAVVEAFGCELPAAFQAGLARKAQAQGRQPVWLNLEYLTAEAFARRSHRLPSPILSGPAAGLTKHFFYPGFMPGTGGLLREPDLAQRQQRFDKASWLRAHNVEAGDAMRIVSLFCYEPPALARLLKQLAQSAKPTALLATAGRASAAVREAVQTLDREDEGWNRASRLEIVWLPLLTQPDFDHLLWSCDLNFVRGEDSLVRALWAGKPFVWQLYPQHDDAHHAKLSAFLDWLDAPASLRDFHHAWNGVSGRLGTFDPPAWSGCAAQARQRLFAQEDLAAQLVRFTEELQRAAAAGPRQDANKSSRGS